MHRDRDVVHAADRFTCRRHRILGEIEEGEEVAVADVEEEVRRARKVAVLEQLDKRESEHLGIELHGAVDVRADQREMMHTSRR